MTKKAFKDVAERTIRTFVQAFAASLVVTGLDDWEDALKVSGVAGVLAVAASIAGTQIGNRNSGSLVE